MTEEHSLEGKEAKRLMALLEDYDKKEQQVETLSVINKKLQENLKEMNHLIKE